MTKQPFHSLDVPGYPNGYGAVETFTANATTACRKESFRYCVTDGLSAPDLVQEAVLPPYAHRVQNLSANRQVLDA